MRILVVENHADTLKYIKMYLESLGHSVSTAVTMQAALDASPTEDCQVVLSDIGLPDGDGWQLLERARFPRPVYAVAMSGFAAEGDFDRSKAAGFRRHIVKPFGGEDLVEILEEASREIHARLPERHVRNIRVPRRKKTVEKKTTSLTLEQIADRLHHSTCQNVLGAQLLLCVLRDQLPDDADEVRKLVKQVQRVLDEAGAELSALMRELRTGGEGAVVSEHRLPSTATTASGTPASATTTT